MSKEEVQGHLNKIRGDVDQIQEQQRREWLQQIVKEAKDRYGFKTLGELVAFIVCHAMELRSIDRRLGWPEKLVEAENQISLRARQKRRAARMPKSETPARSEEIALKFG
jgi:hypothetical protein